MVGEAAVVQVAPGEAAPFCAAGSALPFRFGGEPSTGEAAVRIGVVPGDERDREVGAIEAPRAARVGGSEQRPSSTHLR